MRAASAIAIVASATPSVEVALGYRFLFVDLGENSGEDGNFITLSAHGAMIGVTVSVLMRRATEVAATALFLALVAGPAGAAAAAEEAPAVAVGEKEAGFRAGLDVFVGSRADSRTRVREHQTQGNRLALGDDLGIDVAGEIRARVGYRFDPSNELTFGLGHIFLWGGTRLDRDITYNSTTYQGGTRLEAHPLWLVFELRYERTLVRWGEDERGALALDLGLRCDFLHWSFHGTLSPATTGHEQGEGFDAQATPIPTFGLALRQPLARDLDLTALARGFRANHWDSLRKEGGIIFFSESFVEAGIALAYRATPSVEVAFGYRFLFVDLGEKSEEDGNYITLSAHGALIGVTVSF